MPRKILNNLDYNKCEKKIGRPFYVDKVVVLKDYINTVHP